jgi:glycosyltransferase involved in cell wall biosynthesis
VSVHMITYNHERFIRQAVESVLMQKVDFQYELVIGEDCSTDRTREILLRFRQEYPDRVRLLLHERRLGLGKNFIRTIKACQGQYVALLEGDDYWTSPHKLQKQADFLDAHPGYSTCFHSTRVISEGDGGKNQLHLSISPVTKVTFTFEDILASNFMRTCSVMFRNGLIGEPPDWLEYVRPLDWALHILNAHEGKIGFINETMAVYRVHAGGVWSGKNTAYTLQECFRMLEQVNAHYALHYDRMIGGTLSLLRLGLALALAREGDSVRAREYARTCTAEYSQHRGFPWILLIVMWLVVWFPQLYRVVMFAPKVVRERIAGRK